MWLKLALGAWAGIAIGHFVPWGYAFWLPVGVVVAFFIELWMCRRREAAEAERRDGTAP